MKAWIALDIGGTKIRRAIVTDAGELHRRDQWPLDKFRDPRRARTLVEEAWSGLEGPRPSGVGIAVAAMIDSDGVIRAAPNLNAWVGTSLLDVFSVNAGLPVHAVFDGTAALLGELWIGRPEVRNGYVMSIGTGIGGGLAVDGRVLYGAHGLSGMPPRRLAHDQRGLEAISSGPGVANAIGAASGAEAAKRCRAGDPTAIAAFRSASNALYEVIAAVTAAVDVDTVIIAGGFGAGAFDLLFPSAELPEGHRHYPLVHNDVRISVAATGSDAALFGAARYAALREGSET